MTNAISSQQSQSSYPTLSYLSDYKRGQNRPMTSREQPVRLLCEISSFSNSGVFSQLHKNKKSKPIYEKQSS